MQLPLVKTHAEYDASKPMMWTKFICIKIAVKLMKLSAAFKIRMASYRNLQNLAEKNCRQF